ncbi:FG-GAP-like repeat-containing protein [Streptomyces sp. NPDC003758]
MKRLPRPLAAALLGLISAVLALLPGTVASASTLLADGQVATSTPITRTDPSAYTLTWDATDTGYAQAVQNANPSLAPVPLTTVAGQATTPAQALCTSTGDLTTAQGFCWNAANGDETGTSWVPQGVTTSSGAGTTGLVNGRKLVLVSWHNSDDSQVRVTVADETNPSAVTYLHALLVVPSKNPATGFTAMPGHGDAVVLYEDKLYVGNRVPSVDGTPANEYSGFDVFDLNDFWAVDTTRTTVGLGTDGKFHADGFPYVLPRIGTFTYPIPNSCSQDQPTQPCISGASLDTSQATPALVTVAGSDQAPTFGAGNGTIVRWPLDPATGLLAMTSGTAHASDAFLDSVPGVQGIAMRHDQFLLSGPCPEWVKGGTTSPYCLYQAWLGEPVLLTARVATNGENIAYDTQHDELWYVNEYSQDRLAIHIPWPTFQPPLQHPAAADFTGDRQADIVGIEPASGNLYLYPGAGGGTVGSRTQIGSNWGGMQQLAAGDFTGDGKPDLIALDSSGALWLYPGSGTLNGMNTLGVRTQIGSNWGGMRQLAVMDVSGDGRPDLIALDSSGALWAYPGSGTLNGMNTLGVRTQIGSNWGGMQLAAPGPLTAGGKPVLLAVDTAGALWAYPSTGTLNGMSTLGSRTQIGTNWTSMQQLVGADFNGDGIGDLDAIQTSDGGLYFYPGSGTLNGMNTLGSRTQISTNW